MNKERMIELGNIIDFRLAGEIEEHRRMLDHHMPDIVLKKHEKDIQEWSDIKEVIRLYIQAIDLDIIIDDDRPQISSHGTIAGWTFGDIQTGTLTSSINDIPYTTEVKTMEGPRVIHEANGSEYWDFGNAITKDIPASKKEYVGPDMVNQPHHYTVGQYEVLDVIKDWLTEEEFRGYIKGNVIKYAARERFKNGDEDMKKAEFYLHYLNSNGEKGIK